MYGARAIMGKGGLDLCSDTRGAKSSGWASKPTSGDHGWSRGGQKWRGGGDLPSKELVPDKVNVDRGQGRAWALYGVMMHLQARGNPFLPAGKDRYRNNGDGIS